MEASLKPIDPRSAKRSPDNEGGRSRKKDLFPPTAKTLLRKNLEREDAEANREVQRHVMEVYYHPLQVYYQGSSFRRLGPAEEVVASFFASRLDRKSFYTGWRESGARFRFWLLRSFIQYLYEFVRRTKRERRAGPLEEEVPTWPDTEEALDREFARSVVAEALRRTRLLCEEEGLTEHYQVLISRYYEGQAYGEIARKLGGSEAQARGMARTARERYRGCLRDLLKGDGVPSGEIDREIESIIEALQ